MMDSSSSSSSSSSSTSNPPVRDARMFSSFCVLARHFTPWWRAAAATAAVNACRVRRSRRKRTLLLLVLILCGYSILSMWIASGQLSQLGAEQQQQQQQQQNYGSSSSSSSSSSRSMKSITKRERKDDEFAACLLVMDDSHFLMEWLAYHYHAVNLRTLILVADPNSQTSPRRHVLDRWSDYMDIWQWKDADFGTREEFQEALRNVQRYFGPSLSPTLARHRARQRLFYYKCLQTLQLQGQHWTLLTDTDEFITINYAIANEYNLTDPSYLKPPNQPGAVATFIVQYADAARIDSGPPRNNPPLMDLQSSPCVQIPRVRFGAQESKQRYDIQRNVPTVGGGYYNASDFLTLRWRAHALENDGSINKISKALLDLSRLDRDEIVPVTSIHLPIRTLCQQRRLHTRPSQSLLKIHHYLGSREQYLYRENDARIDDQVLRSMEQFEKQSAGASQQTDDDEIRPWLEGFHQHPPQPLHNNHHNFNRSFAPDFLKDVGKLQPKSWTTYEGDPNKERCAFCFFGLPRAFQSLVLPSIIQNLLIPNARHNCDVFVHFFQQYEETAGRKNRGGSVDPHQVFLLEQAVQDVQDQHGPPVDARTHRRPTVSFTFDTEADFWKKRGPIIEIFQNTTRPDDGLPMYFPYKARTYQKSSLDNIVRQWHSIESAFRLMEITARQMGVQYTRVGMFRSDVLYMTPIDIAMLDNGVVDSRNRHVVVAGFAQMPVNDRMIYGNYQGVEIWATHRFSLIEERARINPEPGYVMHSERFLNFTVFPAMKAAAGISSVHTNHDICFVRTRADESAMISDCARSGVTRGWGQVDKQALVERIIGRNCTRFQMGRKWVFLGCGENVPYQSGK